MMTGMSDYSVLGAAFFVRATPSPTPSAITMMMITTTSKHHHEILLCLLRHLRHILDHRLLQCQLGLESLEEIDKLLEGTTNLLHVIVLGTDVAEDRRRLA
jgi:hypothetical protein